VETAEIFMRLKAVKKLSRFQQALMTVLMRNIDGERVAKNLLAF